jgi:hypothetical protein
LRPHGLCHGLQLLHVQLFLKLCEVVLLYTVSVLPKYHVMPLSLSCAVRP